MKFVFKDVRGLQDFFLRGNHNIVKVILIKGGFHMVSETKKTVYQKYLQFFNFEGLHLQHESEQYTEVAKLSAHQKVKCYKQFVESVRDITLSILSRNIDDIVKAAVNRTFLNECIIDLCFDAVIQESGNINSDPYICRSSLTVNRLKHELICKTVESLGRYLGSEICSESQRRIETVIQNKLRINTDSYSKVVNFPSLYQKYLLETMLTVIASILKPFLGPLFSLINVLGTVLFAVNVNSRSWRRDVATEIYKYLDENKEDVSKELSSDIQKLYRKTADHLKLIAEILEEFRYRIHLNRQDTRELFFWVSYNITKLFC